MRNDVEHYIRQCIICLRNDKKPTLESDAKSLRMDGIFDRIGIVLLFGLLTTSEGYKGILVITEYLSKFPFAVPIKSKSAEEVANYLWNYIVIFGPPGEMLSDHGKEL